MVDDDIPTNFINQRIIESTGLDVHIQVCESGIEALEYLKKEDQQLQPSLIFLDINMPGMNGWEFLDEFEKIPAEDRSNIIVSMLSTSINPDDKRKAQERTSVETFFSKPLKSEYLDLLMKKHFT